MKNACENKLGNVLQQRLVRYTCRHMHAKQLPKRGRQCKQANLKQSCGCVDLAQPYLDVELLRDINVLLAVQVNNLQCLEQRKAFI